MKVLQIVDSLSISNGISSAIMNWYRNIDREEIQFDFLVSMKRDDSYENEICSLGGNIYYMQDTPRITDMLLLIKNVKKFYEQNGNKYDIAHLHSSTFVGIYFYYAKKYGISYRIVQAHSCAYANSKIKAIRNYLMLLPMPLLCTHYIACSKTAGEFLYSKNNINYTIINNGVDFDYFHFNETQRNESRTSWKYENNIVIGHISNMTELKRVDVVIEIFYELFKKNNAYRLVLVGAKEIPQNAQNLIAKYDLNPYIKNVGISKQIPSIMSGMDICFMPSEKEGLGLVAVECQANSLPVIVSEGFPKDVFVTERIKKYECNDTIKEISAYIIELLKYDRQNIDLNAAKKVYDIKIIAQSISNFYRKIQGV